MVSIKQLAEGALKQIDQNKVIAELAREGSAAARASVCALLEKQTGLPHAICMKASAEVVRQLSSQIRSRVQQK